MINKEVNICQMIINATGKICSVPKGYEVSGVGDTELQFDIGYSTWLPQIVWHFFAEN